MIIILKNFNSLHNLWKRLHICIKPIQILKNNLKKTL
jgi:hypothetical protein